MLYPVDIIYLFRPVEQRAQEVGSTGQKAVGHLVSRQICVDCVAHDYVIFVLYYYIMNPPKRRRMTRTR